MRFVIAACLSVLFVGNASAQESSAPPIALEQAQPDTTVVQSPDQLKETMATVGLTRLPGGRDWQREKSAKVAVFSSMLLPGLGQAYNGRKWKSAIAFGLFTFYAGNAWVQHKKSEGFLGLRDSFPSNTPEWAITDEFYQFHKGNAGDYLWWAGAVWFIGLLDAFVDAHLFDVRAVDPDVFRASTGKNYIGLSYDL
jgi:hypothetical protein